MHPNVVDEPSFRNRKHVFRDRVQAAELVAERLRCYSAPETLLLAIPSGGVPIACTVSGELGCPMDLIVVRKIPIPWNPEAGFGAVTLDGAMVLNDHIVRELNLSEEEIATLASKVVTIVRERAKKFGSAELKAPLKDKTAIITDDGLASGYTMLAAIGSVRKGQPKQVVVAVPTASTSALRLVAPLADKVVCLNIRDEPIYAVADAYQNWRDLSDQEVLTYLKQMKTYAANAL